MDRPASEWRAHWPVVAGAGIGMGASFALWQYVQSLFVPELTAAFGWTRGQMMGAMAAGLVGALAAPLIGRIADRIGVRRVIVTATLLLALAYVGFANQPGTLPAYFALTFFHTVVGIGCGAAIYTRAVAGWFDRNRGLALGVAITTIAAFAALVPPLLRTAMDAYGWQAGYYVLAALALGIGLPAGLTVRERREAQPAGGAEGSSPTSPSDVPRDAGARWSDMLRDRRYWLLLVAVALVNLPGTGLLSQLAPLLTDGGLTPQAAAGLVSLFAGAVIVGRLATGFLVDRMRASVVAFVFAAAPAAGCAILLGAEPTLALAALAVVLIGLQQGSEIDLIGYLISRIFGLRNYSAAFGSTVTVLALSGAAGAAFFGASHDAVGSYATALTVSIPLFLAGATAFLFMGDVRTKAPAAGAVPAE